MKLVKLPVLSAHDDDVVEQTDIWVNADAIGAITPLNGDRCMVWIDVTNETVYLVALPIDEVIGRLA